MAVTLNTKYLAPFVQSHELAAVAPQVEAAHRTLHEKTGLGTSCSHWHWRFLPWGQGGNRIAPFPAV